MKQPENRRSMLFTRLLGCIAIAASVYITLIALDRNRGGEISSFRVGALFLLGVSFVVLTFNWRRIGIAAGIGCFLCLATGDVVQWKQGLKPLVDVLIPWGVILPGVVLILYVIVRRQRLKAMHQAGILSRLRTPGKATEILEREFDFRIAPQGTISRLIQLDPAANFDLVATDASGGEFILFDCVMLEMRPMMYVSSEGQAGVISKDLESGLSIIIDLPYWQDCLKFSKGGQLAEMRRVIPLAEADLLADKPHIASNRQVVRHALGVGCLPDPVQELHKAVTEISQLIPARLPEGHEFQTLFGSFIVESNGSWRRRLTSQQ